MPFLQNVEIHFARLHPKFPNKHNADNPTWEVQLRTTSKVVKKEWEALGLPIKAIVPDDDSAPYFRAMLRRKSLKKDGTPNTPVELVDGDRNPLEPNLVGNGSIANIRIFQYDYPDKTNPGLMKKASILSAVQITTLIKSTYTPKPREEFDVAPMKVIDPAAAKTAAPEYDAPDEDDPF